MRSRYIFLLLTIAVVFAHSTGTAAASPSKPALNAKSLNAAALIILDNDRQVALLARNPDQVRAIASLTKLQVALVLRAYQLNPDGASKITRDDHEIARGGARSRLRLYWTYRNVDLLHAMLVASDNRAVSALGRSVDLSAMNLVTAMNEFAAQYRFRSTHFAGPVGIHHENVSTAREIAQIAQAASLDPLLRQIMRCRDHRVKPLRGHRQIHYTNTNPLVGKVAGVTFLASKTGFNSAAGYCLAAVVRIAEKREFTIVLLGARTSRERLDDLSRIISWLKKGLISA